MPAPRTLDLDHATPLLDKRARAVFRWLPQALTGDEEAVHEMRVAARRLRVTLVLLARKPKGRRVRRALRVLRDLTRTPGASRDLDVGVALFDQRLESLGPQTPEHTLLRRHLRGARRRSRAEMTETLLDLQIARLRSDLRTVLSRRADQAFRILQRVRDTRDALGGTLVAGLAAIGNRYDPDALHRLRGRARRLRYVAEVADTLRGQDSGAPALLKKVQAHVGLVHDNHVLAAWLEAQAAGANPEDASLATEARACQRAFLEERPLELIRKALQAMSQTRTSSGAWYDAHDAERKVPATLGRDGPMTFPLRDRSAAS